MTTGKLIHICWVSGNTDCVFCQATVGSEQVGTPGSLVLGQVGNSLQFINALGWEMLCMFVM